MFTPQEVSEKTFPKSSSFSSGYDLAAVDEFLDTLTEDYTALYKENAALKAKLKILAEKLEEYRATEDTMRSMLLAAQKMAASMTDEAKEKSEKMLADAQSQRHRYSYFRRGPAAAIFPKRRTPPPWPTATSSKRPRPPGKSSPPPRRPCRTMWPRAWPCAGRRCSF